MGTLNKKDHVSTNAFCKYRLYFTVAEMLDIDLALLAPVTLANKLSKVL
jgi:hypothetical protein